MSATLIRSARYALMAFALSHAPAYAGVLDEIRGETAPASSTLAAYEPARPAETAKHDAPNGSVGLKGHDRIPAARSAQSPAAIHAAGFIGHRGASTLLHTPAAAVNPGVAGLARSLAPINHAAAASRAAAAHRPPPRILPVAHASAVSLRNTAGTAAIGGPAAPGRGGIGGQGSGRFQPRTSLDGNALRRRF